MSFLVCYFQKTRKYLYAKVRIFSEKCKYSSFFYAFVSFFPLPLLSPFRIFHPLHYENSFWRRFPCPVCHLPIFGTALSKRLFHGINQVCFSCVFISTLFRSNLRPFPLRFGCFRIAIAMLLHHRKALFMVKFWLICDIFRTFLLYIHSSKAQL